MPARIRSFLPYRQKMARNLLLRLPDAGVENPEQSRSCIIPVSRPSAAFGRWPKASLYTGMVHDPRSISRSAADAISEFDGKKLRIHTGANRRVAFGVRRGRGDDAAAGGDDAAGEHEVVVQFERLDRHAVGIFLFPRRAHAHGATIEVGDTIEERPGIVGVGEDRA